MKKRIAAFFLCGILACSMAGCGGEKEETPLRSGQYEINPKELVTNLCEYKKIPLTLDASYEVTDENKEEVLKNVFASFGIGYKEVTDRTTVQDGDYVNVDFTGYFNGEAFEGGAAKGVLIDVDKNAAVGSGNGYIEGFSDGLKGAEVGSTVSSEVRFPDSYPQNEDLAGQMTTFEFVINGIYSKETISMDEVTDEFVKENLQTVYGFSTKEELMDAIEGSLESTLDSARVQLAKDYMREHCTVTIPEDYFEARVREYQDSLVKQYCKEGETLEDFVKSNYGGTMEEFEEECRSMLKEQVEVELIFSVIAEEQGIEIDESDYNSYVQYFVQNLSFNFAKEEDVYEYFGAGNVEEGEIYLRRLFATNLAIDFVADQAEVTFEEKK